MENTFQLTFFSATSILTLLVVYYFLITEKLNKVIVTTIGASLVILLQVFRTAEKTSQSVALEFVSHNLDILGFVLGMMILIGLVRQSGFFESLAISLVKKVKGNPQKLLVVFGYLSLFMTALFSNIPTILILTPILLILVKELKLPYLPYIFIMIAMANLGGAMTPISDPTTYYQSKVVGLGFLEVVSNSGVMVLLLSVVSTIYALKVFKKDLLKVKVNPKDVALFNPKEAIKDRKMLKIGMPILGIVILLLVSREFISKLTGLTFENATITLTAAFILMIIFNKEPKEIFKEIVDWEILAFFTGLFIVVGSLEHTHVISGLAEYLIRLTGGNGVLLTLFTAVGSGALSTFIDNVPYNITMVSAIQKMAETGIYVYPLWWALNLGTSIGGIGSPIAATCNVLAFGQAERENFHTNFVKYLKTAFPLVLINSLIVFGILYLRFYAVK